MKGITEPSSLTPLDNRLPTLDSRLTPVQETFALTLTLLAGLILFAPVFELVVTTIGVSLPQPLLIGVGLTWVGYGVLLVALRRLVDGLFIGLLISSTFAANVPLTSAALRFPGDSIATLMMFHGPLFGLLVFAIVFKWYRTNVPRLAYAFAAFVGAIVLSALFGGGPNTTVALWFSLYVLVGLLVYLVTIWTIQRTSITLDESIGVFFVVVCAQALVGVVQLVRGEPFGLSELGEGAASGGEVLTVPFLGSISLGTHVSGFTGMSFQLANLLLLAFPLLVVGYVKVSGWKRILPIGVGFVFVLLIRASVSDAARGAFVVELLTLVGLFLIIYLPRLTLLISRVREATDKVIQEVISAIGLLVVLLYPSSGAGQSTSQSSLSQSSESQGASEGETANAGDINSPSKTWLREQVESLSIPLFDLSNLGTRVNQYLAGIDVFLQYPLFGIGGMNFVLIGHQYGIMSPEQTDLTYPVHSLYISLLAETGLVGFSTFAITVGFIYLYGYRSARSQTMIRAVPLALLAGLSGTLAFMLFDVFLFTNAAAWAQFWIIAAFITVFYQQKRDETASGLLQFHDI
jgi:hypothetical protein